MYSEGLSDGIRCPEVHTEYGRCNRTLLVDRPGVYNPHDGEHSALVATPTGHKTVSWGNP